MRKFKLVIILAISVLNFGAQAQSSFTKGDLIANLGVGLGSYIGGSEGQTKSVQLASSDTLTLWATSYYVFQKAFDSNGIALKDVNEQYIGARLLQSDWCKAAMQGTVYTTDSLGNFMTLNVAGKRSAKPQADCKSCNDTVRTCYALWAKAKGKYGDGAVNGYVIVPYRTIAVDKKVIPLGSLVFIPEAVGTKIQLPDKTVFIHDGYFFAADVGSLIKGNHIDVFTGMSEKCPFSFVKSKQQHTFKAFIINDKEILEKLRKEHQTP
jgi:3D (Asp-Asp-Asp) domain-containing protein